MPPEIVEHPPLIPRRARDSHKGDFGRILVVAGSRGMAGAAALVGASALRSGAGLVRVACPAEVQPVVASFEPSYMTYPLPQTSEGRISFRDSEPLLREFAAEADVVAAGPGLGRSQEITALVDWLLETVDRPLVLDADALNALAGRADRLARRAWPTIVTPHPGECARLTGRTIEAIQADRQQVAADLAGTGGQLVVLLKGAGTVVTDGRRLYLNRSGNPGMATGGAGDVLTGVIAGLLGQGLAPFDAAALGAHAHGLAGDIARDSNGEVGLIAGDLVDALPDAFVHLTDLEVD